jgi:hypothetical protein
MNGDSRSDARLSDELAKVARVAGEGEGCPPAESLWLSARDELDPGEREEIVLHNARCTACALAWRIAHDLAREEKGALPVSEESPRGRRGWTYLALAATVVVVAGLGVTWFTQRPVPPEALRTQQGERIESALDEAVVLPRENLVLRWSEGEPGTAYDVKVTTESLDLLVQESGLDRPELRLAPELLGELPPGSRLYWRVTARLPDGRSLESDTFIAQIE